MTTPDAPDQYEARRINGSWVVFDTRQQKVVTTFGGSVREGSKARQFAANANAAPKNAEGKWL